MFNHLNPTIDERRRIIVEVASLFKGRFYNPTLDGFDLDCHLESEMDFLLQTHEFAIALKAILCTTGAHPIDVFYEPERTLPIHKFLKVTLFDTTNGECFFRDILIGGRAEEASIQSGDQLLKINGEDPRGIRSSVHAHLPFQIIVQRRGALSRTLSFPAPSSCKIRSERNVDFRKLSDRTGYLRIASWPGILGIEVARETDVAVRALNCKRLVIDLRGNLGSAGAGNLRLMSYLTPERVPVGFSLTRRRAQEGYDRTQLPRFTRIPRFKAEGLAVLWKFRKLDKSIVVVTEGLKKQQFHGEISVLVNEHTISGAEIVVHFAKQRGLAKIVGERTAGQSLSYSTFNLPFDFRLTLPIGDYIPWFGERFEGCGVQPDVEIPFCTPSHRAADPQLEKALSLIA